MKFRECKTKLFAFVFLLIAAFGCKSEPTTAETSEYARVKEIAPVEIKLAHPYDSEIYEYSGLAVYNEKLIIMPQYIFGLQKISKDESEKIYAKDTVGYIYSIDFSVIRDYLASGSEGAIMPDSIKIIGSGLERFNHRGSGYEAIAFIGNDVYLSIEDIGNPTKSYLVKGKIFPDENTIRLDAQTLAELPEVTHIRNIGYETVVKFGDKMIAVNELNGKNNWTSPKAFEHNANLQPVKSYKLPHIEYRITDATYCEGNFFWAINYFWPGDFEEINPAADEIAKKYGIGEHQSTTKGIERILKFKVSSDSVTVASKPIYILPSAEGSTNWEGIAKFDEGFILISDSYPRTRLVFVANNQK